MKLKFTAIFLPILILSFCFPFTAFSADYPIVTFAAYWRYTVDGVTWTTVNVTPSVTRNGLTFSFPDYSFIQYAQLYLTSYSGSPSTDVNIRSISNVSGYAFVSNNVPTQRFNISARSQYYNGSQWVEDGVSNFDSGSFFFLAPDTGMSARLLFYVTGYNNSIFSGQGFEISFSNLLINDASVESNAFIKSSLDDINSSLSDITSSLIFNDNEAEYISSEVDKFEEIASSDMDFLIALPTPDPQSFDDISGAFDDIAVSYLDDQSELYQAVISPFYSNPIVIAVISIVCVCAVISYIVFGKAG